MKTILVVNYMIKVTSQCFKQMIEPTEKEVSTPMLAAGDAGKKQIQKTVSFTGTYTWDNDGSGTMDLLSST